MDKGFTTEFLTKKSPPLWLRGNEKFIFSTTVALNRNLTGYKFPNKANLEEKRKVCAKILGKIHYGPLSFQFMFDSVKNMSMETKKLLFERRDTYCCTRDPDPSDEAKVVLANNDESVVIVVNDEDHLQVKASCPGLDFEKCHGIAENILNQLDLDFALDKTFGFLTSMPAIMTTGLQTEVTLHLPGIMSTENAEKWVEQMRFSGVLAEGIFGTGSSPHGNVFTLCNQNTRRKTVEQTFALFKKVLDEVFKREAECRSDDDNLEKKDMIGRAYGMLKYAEKMDFSEAMAGVSLIRMGIEENIFNPISYETLNKLTWYLFPTQILSMLNCPADELDIVRAKIIRQALSREKK